MQKHQISILASCFAMIAGLAGCGRIGDGTGVPPPPAGSGAAAGKAVSRSKGAIGRKTVQAILQHFAGEEVPAQILIPTQLYRRADAEKDPELK